MGGSGRVHKRMVSELYESFKIEDSWWYNRRIKIDTCMKLVKISNPNDSSSEDKAHGINRSQLNLNCQVAGYLVITCYQLMRRKNAESVFQWVAIVSTATVIVQSHSPLLF